MNKKTRKNKGKEVTISAKELTRFGIGVMTRALKIVNTAKKGKLTIKIERE